MNYQSIGEIYAANDKIREKLISTLESLSPAQAAALPEGEKWTIAEFVEHISIVEEGMMRICAKLLRKAEAENRRSDGSAKFSAVFTESVLGAADKKLEAPDMVRPTGTKTITESIEKMRGTREKLNELRPLFESVDGAEHKFPHPAFGDLSAHEWLALIGGHEARHLRQMKGILEKINKMQ